MSQPMRIRILTGGRHCPV